MMQLWGRLDLPCSVQVVQGSSGALLKREYADPNPLPKPNPDLADSILHTDF